MLYCGPTSPQLGQHFAKKGLAWKTAFHWRRGRQGIYIWLPDKVTVSLLQMYWLNNTSLQHIEALLVPVPVSNLAQETTLSWIYPIKPHPPPTCSRPPCPQYPRSSWSCRAPLLSTTPSSLLNQTSLFRPWGWVRGQSPPEPCICPCLWATPMRREPGSGALHGSCVSTVLILC